MGFVGIYTAVYDYQPQAEGELEIHENDLLYVLDKDDDDWWKAKKKAADPEDEEPVGLVPNNYVQEVRGIRPFTHNDRYSMYSQSILRGISTRNVEKNSSGFPESLTIDNVHV